MSDLSWRFNNYERQYIEEVLSSGFASSTSGSMNTRLEKAFASKMGRNFCITFNSGTTTLHAALMALGVGYGDEVIIPALTVISCMNAVLYCNAVPIFADVDLNTFLIDTEDIKRKITPKTKAIMPVHLYGATCDMTEIMKIAKEYNLAVVEDCAQNYLGQHKGKYAGTFGDVGSWSFENSKHLTTGDGGIIACDDEELGDKIRKLNCQGYKNCTAVSGKIRIGKDIFQDPEYKRHSILGYMYRLPEVCAAMGLAQLEKIEWFVGLRQSAAHYYLSAIMDSGVNWLVPQHIPRLDTSSYYTYACKLKNSDINWKDFREKYKELSGDGIYAAWTLLYKEGSTEDVKRYMKSLKLPTNTFNTVCPNAEKIQPQLMQFPTNMKDTDEMKKCAEALYKTIIYFK